MALKLFADRVKETTTSTGTGTINLAGAVTGFRTFVAGIGDGKQCYYAIIFESAGEWEIGIGTVTDASPDTLSRTTVLASSNAGSAVNFSAGTKNVFCTNPAAAMPDWGGVNFTAADAAPSNPTADDIWYDTDTNIWWFWNGTYWLSCQLFDVRKDFSETVDKQWYLLPPEIDQAIQHDLFIVDLCTAMYVAATNDGSNYWTLAARRMDDVLSATSLGVLNTSGNTLERMTVQKAQIDAHIDLSAVTVRTFNVLAQKTSSPGALIGSCILTYRWAHL